MSSTKQQYQILIFGDSEIVKKFSQYLGFEQKSQRMGLVYFEFPNENFVHKQSTRLFSEKLKIYIAQPALLNTLMAPKSSFNSTDAIVMMHSNHNDSLNHECFEYLEKFAVTRCSLVPILSVGCNLLDNSDKRNLNRFFFNLEYIKALNEIFNVPAFYFDLTEDENEPQFFAKLIDLIDAAKEKSYKKHSKITIERMMQSLRDRIIDLKANPPSIENGVRNLGELEHIRRFRITRHSLVTKWGLKNDDAIKIINYWEKLPDLTRIYEEERLLLLEDGKRKITKCKQLNLDPNLITLLMLDYDFTESKKALCVLNDSGIIKKVAFHMPSFEYKLYDNLQDIVIISKGRNIYVRTPSKKPEEINMFSGLIQTMEIVRNKYMEDKANLTDWLKINPVDFLDFGKLHAVIGTGNNNLKLILRFKERPQTIYIEKTKDFLKEFEDAVGDKLKSKMIDLQQIKPAIDKLYYKFYNPFPQKASFDQIIQVSDTIKNLNIDRLTDTEKLMIDILRKKGGLTISGILSHVKESSCIAESDLLQIVFDLIKENYLH